MKQREKLILTVSPEPSPEIPAGGLKEPALEWESLPTLYQQESLALSPAVGAGGRVPVSIENPVTPTEAVTEPHPINRRLEKHPPP